MREILLSDLVKHVLGPRGGPEERIKDPAFEYITGMLAPVGEGLQDVEDVVSEEGRSGIDQDDQYEAAVGEVHPAAPALDPKSIPSTMGLSFFVEAEDPRFRVCVTWARYTPGGGLWTRRPFREIFEVGGTKNYRRTLQRGGRQEDEVLFHYNTDRGTGASGKIHVSMFMENCIASAEKGGRAGRYVFQPQIRVVCGKDTEIVPGFRAPAAGCGEAEADLIYESRPFLARGHLTSVLWRAIDPEGDLGGSVDADPEAAGSPPFGWVDGYALPEKDRKDFSPPDVRTEYVPTCSIPAPALDWDGLEIPPAPSAGELADAYDPELLRGALLPLADEYGAWIGRIEKKVASMPERLREAGTRMINDCRNIRRRIVAGIRTLLDNDDARLAFCFANKVMDQQRLWAKGKHMRYRPFQLAFILAALESVVDPKSQDRDVCDLLWVPTGAGKTEAYLAVAAAVLAYRRLAHLDRHSGAGVSVITRYTLRLLTIQQFRRTLPVIAAAECLRVSGLGSGGPAGWRPVGCTRGDDFIWGTAPFSAGLWVGESLTPNWLHAKPGTGSRKHFYMRPGAIDMLKGEASPEEGAGDPAQVTECPACSGILAVPDGGLEAGRDHTLHFVVRSEKAIPEGPVQASGAGYGGASVRAIRCTPHHGRGYFTISVDVTGGSALMQDGVEGLWKSVSRSLRSAGVEVELCPASALRPGYFLRSYKTSRMRGPCPYDFDIVCPNPGCPMRTKWMGGSPQGKVHGDVAGAPEEDLPGDAVPEDVIEPFRDGSRCVADRVPIKAFTVDEQVYREAPSVVVATVDKFARLPFEPRAAAIFGNVSYHHHLDGYTRRQGKTAGKGDYRMIERGLARPDLIIQDELHLIDGPLGSMVGAYESAVDFLSSGGGQPVKYIASTATISNPEDHVRSILNRRLMLFPPVGINGDRFFIRERTAHQLNDEIDGRLYVGVCCPGQGPLTPMIRMWARLAQTTYNHRDAVADIDRFWTLTGYFNSVRELAGVRATYVQDIPEWIKHMADGPERELDLDSSIELSSRTGSARLPSVLDRLGRPYQDGLDSPDGLFTTSMFGTGVDIQRIGLMLVDGQPKTATSYIQSTGRAGRRGGALVVTFFRASRPRDLNHYEFFARHHLQLHRFVEPVTAYPFASGMLDRVLGPVALGMLRNMRIRNGEWDRKEGNVIAGRRDADELARIKEYLLDRSKMQPGTRKPVPAKVSKNLDRGWDRWDCMADKDAGILFRDYDGAKGSVVLGGQQNRKRGAVFMDVPRSLRELEDETGFQT